jgi:hypothetical protein
MEMENDNSRQEIWSPYLWHCVGNEKRLIQFHISGIHISGVVMAIKNADSRPDIWSQYFWSHEGNEHCRVKARYTVIYVYIRTSTLTSTSNIDIDIATSTPRTTSMSTSIIDIDEVWMMNRELFDFLDR